MGRDLRDVEAALTPCQVCWHPQPWWDEWEQLAHEVERDPDSGLAEAPFVRQVLRRVEGLRASYVRRQYETQAGGRTYRLDFVVERPGLERIAFEVDGWNKAPGSKSPEQVRREVEQRRAKLRETGWRICNISNEAVLSRSRDAIAEVEGALRDAERPKGSLFELPPPPAAAAPATPRPAPMPTPAPLPSSPTPTGTPAPAPAAHATAQPESRGSSRRFTYVVAAGLIGCAVAALAIFLAGQREPAESPAAPVGQDCPSSAPIKGNSTESGEKIFHEPGWRYYEATRPEECFNDAAGAGAAGYRSSEVQ